VPPLLPVQAQVVVVPLSLSPVAVPAVQVSAVVPQAPLIGSGKLHEALLLASSLLHEALVPPLVPAQVQVMVPVPVQVQVVVVPLSLSLPAVPAMQA